MGKDKLFRFAEISKMKHVIEPTIEMVLNQNHLKGNWNRDFFKNDNPIILELGCGKGEYAVALAKKYPQQNFIAVDIKGDRIFIGAKQVQDEKLKNILFLRTKIDFSNFIFFKKSINEIYFGS